eukprot:3131271-Pleurochrysis_carterae.AAC.1
MSRRVVDSMLLLQKWCADPSSSELSSRSFSTMMCAAASVPDAMPFSTRALRSSEALVLDVLPSPMRVVVAVATQPVL